MTKTRRLWGLLLAGLLGLALTPFVAAAPAQAANLWSCDIPRLGAGTCTTITSAPSTGVSVLDRNSGQIFKLYNGNSVQLYGWGHDPSRQCGVQNGYFWKVQWVRPNGAVSAVYIGDYYLATGHPSSWKQMGFRELGTGSGTCDRISPRPPDDW